MSRLALILFLTIFFLNACSVDKKNYNWLKSSKIKKEPEKTIIKELFRDEKNLDKEFNESLKINLSSQFQANSLKKKLENNIGRVNYDSSLKKISKFKFSKIDNFNQNQSEVIFDDENVIFYNKKGTIIKFDNSSKSIWEKNYYSKKEKKIKPFLFFAKDKNTLIVADNISKYYAINIVNGELLWSKNNSSPFNSQIKIYKDKLYIIDFENVLHCYSIKNGNKIWDFKSENVFIKSQKKLSIAISEGIIYFNNSVGDINALDANNGKLIWQLPTQNSQIYEDSFLLKSSDLVITKKTILFSNNRNEFYSINKRTGLLNWSQKINSSLRPTIVEKLIFTVSLEGFLIVMDRTTGSIIRVTDLFNVFKEKKRLDIIPIGFVIGAKDIFLTTNNGRLLVIDIKSGKTVKSIKIDGNQVSAPVIANKNLHIIKNDMIVRFD
ncbi:PQQ-binding-like beta-propeller repeat protein [Candidatus Pelagibacter sp.]|nr:PQQ-binding-like beta-propeller repeat protein [Candidatus Pelagibacter sp.]